MDSEYYGSKNRINKIVWNWYKYRRWSNGEYGHNLKEWMKHHNIKGYFLVWSWVIIKSKCYIKYTNNG